MLDKYLNCFQVTRRGGFIHLPCFASHTSTLFAFVIHFFFSFTDWLTDGALRLWSPALQQLTFSLPTVVYVTEARAVKVWRPDRGGLMVGTVARATHKHFRDVNKCVHAQRATMEVFSRLPHIKCTLSSSRKYTSHIQTPNVPIFKKIWWFCQLRVISCRYFSLIRRFRWANMAHSYLFYSYMEAV